jgi:hypothetical protein
VRVQVVHDTLPTCIARLSVGIGSDYDGVETVPEGLEDVSKYPELVSIKSTAELLIHIEPAAYYSCAYLVR